MTLCKKNTQIRLNHSIFSEMIKCKFYNQNEIQINHIKGKNEVSSFEVPRNNLVTIK